MTTEDTMSTNGELRKAAQAVLDRWDSPQWAWTKHGPTADLMQALRAAMAQPAASEPVAHVSECEACFTPDVCQLRGTCAHYAASKLRIAAAPQPAPDRAPLPSVDEFAQHIRWVNGNNKMGAASLAEKLLEWLESRAAHHITAKGQA